MTTPPNTPFPLIVGCGSSGTTLLRAMLDAHPDLAVSLLGRFPVELWPRRSRYLRKGMFDLGRLGEDLVASRPFTEVGPDPEWLRARLSGREPLTYADAMRRVFALYAEAKGKPRYGHKSPDLVRHLDFLAGLFPEARFVHLVRDGRDVALSLLSRSWGPVRVAEAARFWAIRAAAGRRSGERLGTGRYLEVRYEELVGDPEATLSRVCAFIRLEYRSEMLAYHERGIDWMPAHKRSQHIHLLEPARPGIREWRRDLADDDVAMFEAVAGDALTLLGYERRFERVPGRLAGRAKAEAIRTRARWLTGRARRFVRRTRRRTFGGRRDGRRAKAIHPQA